MISYDLMQPGQNYANLDGAIRAAGGREVLRSQWLITATVTANDIWENVKKLVDNNDRLFVTELTKNMQWTGAGLMLTDAEVQSFMTTARQ